MENKVIRDFKKRNKSCLEGVIEDKQTNELYITSLRFCVTTTKGSKTFLINVPDDMIIPAVALTKKDQVCVYAVEDETDRKNGYDGSLRGLANITNGRVYEFKGRNPNEYLRAIIPTSEVK